MNHDRRQHARLIPDSALLVSLGQSKRGFLSDLSEGGMAFDGFPPKGGNNVIFLAFDLPDAGGSIEAIAEVVWTCDSRHRTGVRFLELANTSRRRINTWISSRVFTMAPEKRPEDSEAQKASADSVSATRAVELPLAPPPQAEPIPQAVPALSAPEYQWEEKETTSSHDVAAYQEARRHRKPPSSLGIVLAIVFISSACVSLGYYLPGMFYGRKASGTTAPVSPVVLSTRALVVAVRPPAATKPISESSQRENMGFVLQVAAMAHPENAAALVKKLRQRQFPAFVLNRGNGDFYRVEVGPYPDADYARTVQDDLKAAGFKTILQRRPPQSASN